MNASFCIPNTYGDHMVFQREKPIRLVGTAPAGSLVYADMNGGQFCRHGEAQTRKDGHWEIELAPLEAGGPYEIRIVSTTGTAIVLRDVMVGEVWFLGGQSNMEFPVHCGNPFFQLTDGVEVAAAADDPLLRLYRMPFAVSPDGPCEQAPTGTCWKTADSAEAVAPFSAVGYLFGQRLRKRLGVPVGLIHSNWGGCRIEPWIDEETLRRHRLEKELRMLQQARKPSGKRAMAERRRQYEKICATFAAWHDAFLKSNPAVTAEALRTWAQPDADETGWKAVPFSRIEAGASALSSSGVVWYRATLDIPADWPAGDCELCFAFINDCGEVFWDGEPAGEAKTDVPGYWMQFRSFNIAAARLQPGRHTLAVRVQNHTSTGGLGACSLRHAESGRMAVPAEDAWLERVELRPAANVGPRPEPPILSSVATAERFQFGVPSTLFNAMFWPFHSLTFRGALWYQGCANAGEYDRYHRLQKALVDSWRRATRNPDMVFLCVELAGFLQHTPEKPLPEDFWETAEPVDTPLSHMRVEQEKIRSVRLCDIASAVDVGEHSDVHPKNKREVARRLEALAAKYCYGAEGPCTGPVATRARREGGVIRVSFKNVGQGLELRGGDDFGAHAWAICGRDERWVWADARLDGDTVVVSSPAVPAPVAVRYAWDAYPPQMRLWNRDGFPAFPVAPLKAR